MHCPQCGEATPQGAAACPFCGHALEAHAPTDGKHMARTMMGIPRSVAAAARAAVAGQAPEVNDEAPTIALRGAASAGTIMGLPPTGQPATAGPTRDPEAAARTVVGMRPPVGGAGRASEKEAPSMSDAFVQTRVGFKPPAAEMRSDAGGAAPAPQPAAKTTLGSAGPPDVAPGRPTGPPASAPAPTPRVVSPTRNDERRAPNSYDPSDELGATVAPQMGPIKGPSKRLKAHALAAPRMAVPSLKPPKGLRAPAKQQGSRVTMAILIAGGVLATAAVIFAVLWSGRGPLSARVRMDTQGREVVELSCSSCPDGTVLSTGQASATVSGAIASLEPGTPLSPGDNRIKVRIDRPGNGRDESVTITVNVAYRIRPDISTLQAEKPSIQVVIEVAKGAQVKLDGRSVPLYAGRATETFDVTDACTGLAADATSLSRQIPYVVTTPAGEDEKGSVNVVVSIVPLELEAPGPNVVIDGPSFVIAGRTLKGAELLAAGKPIPVKPDGSFAHVMNVSSVGATQIEVRAKLAGMAPRIAKIKVRRVDNLETAAREFAAEGPIAWSALTPSIAQQAGKPIVVSGQVLEVQREGRRTIMILDVSSTAGCVGCSARLVQGSETQAQVGDKLTAYGHIARAVRLPARGEIPEVQVDFTLKGLR